MNKCYKCASEKNSRWEHRRIRINIDKSFNPVSEFGALPTIDIAKYVIKDICSKCMMIEKLRGE